MYRILIDGKSTGYINTLENIKDGLFELFGDVQIATDDDCMTGIAGSHEIVIESVSE
jgi:hypothetical protein